MTYIIYLDKIKLGTTLFEKADAPMGVVFGKIKFDKINIGYQFIKDYCLSNNIELTYDCPNDQVLSTRTITSLKVINEYGVEIKGVGNQITGMDNDGFEISIEGIPYPFYEKEFSHHREAYDELF